MTSALVVLFTDFGYEGPYVGQVKAALWREAPDAPVVDLMHDAPAHRPDLAAYLLAALAPEFPEGCVFLGVVDPDVGSPARRPVVLCAGGRWYVGPDNGLFEIVARRAGDAEWREIDARPARLSASFHGRDLFAPAAGRLLRGDAVAGVSRDAASRPGSDWPDDLARIVYIDRFGNAMTGMRAKAVPAGKTIAVGNARLPRARTFADLSEGAAFWYENSNGLAEIAVNRGRAADALGLGIGDRVTLAVP
ncbi:MAG: S-adenosyl-l-methionine hydroxide adenosyltransferase family protein [Alphaproteobacteria bacterium]